MLSSQGERCEELVRPRFTIRPRRVYSARAREASMSVTAHRWIAVLAFGLLTISPVFTQDAGFDVLIRGGQVIDGTGASGVRADVGIKGDRIAAVGQLSDQRARRVIDASGLVVAPGFIDLHTHSEMPLVAD